MRSPLAFFGVLLAGVVAGMVTRIFDFAVPVLLFVTALSVLIRVPAPKPSGEPRLQPRARSYGPGRRLSACLWAPEVVDRWAWPVPATWDRTSSNTRTRLGISGTKWQDLTRGRIDLLLRHDG